VVNGRPTTERVFNKPLEVVDRLTRQLGEDAIDRSPFWSRVLTDVQAGRGLPDADFDLVMEELLNEAFGRALGREAREAVYAGRQFDEASIEGVNIGLGTAPSGRVARRGQYARAYRDATGLAKIGGAAIGRAARKVLGKQPKARAVTDFARNTPAPVAAMRRRLNEIMGSIGSNFQRELRDTVMDVRAKGGTPQQAFDEVVARRVERDVQDAVDGVEREVQRLIDTLGMERDYAYYLVGYRDAAGKQVQGLGSQAGQPPPNVVALVRERVVEEVMHTAWQSLIRSFFGAPLYDNLIAASLDNFVKADGVYLRPSIASVRSVLAALRKQMPGLKGRGLAQGVVLADDAVLELLMSWSVGRDRATAVVAEERRLRATHPELFTELTPDAFSAQPSRAMVEATLPQRSRSSLLTTLVELTVPKATPDREAVVESRVRQLLQSQAYQSFLALEQTPTGGPRINPSGAVELKQRGTFTREYDRISHRMLRNVGPAAKRTLVDAALQKMLLEGTPTLDAVDLIRGLDDPVLNSIFFQKQASTEALKGWLRGMDLAVAEAGLGAGGRLDAANPAAVLQAFKGDKADALVYSLVAAAREAGATEDEIVLALRRGVVENTFLSMAMPIVDEVATNASAMGFVPQNVANARTNAVATAANLDPAHPAYLLYGPDYINAVEELRNAASTGRLAENLDALRKRDLFKQVTSGGTADERAQAAWELAVGAITDSWATSRTVAASGLLAGGFYLGTVGGEGDDPGVPVVLPAPNTRYMGMNILTAPVIALATVGGAGALRSLRGPGLDSQSRDVARQLGSLTGRPLVDAVSPRPPQTVVFTSDTGRQWTYGELRAALERNNVQTTRGQVEFTESFIADLKRDARLTSKGDAVGTFRQFLRTFDPRRTNLPQYVANASDRVFRENTFANALKAGMPEEQAAALARAVVLDYGAVHDRIKKTVNRYVLFASFRAAMYTETLRALARDPGTFNRVLLMQRDLQQTGEQWLLGPDYSKTRLPVNLTEFTYEENAAGAMLYGPVLPQVDALKDFINMGAFFGQAGAQDNDAAKRLAEGAA
jgi:hypothetical protein